MDYSVGSLADLISGTTTPNKPKIIEKKVKNELNKSVEAKKTGHPKADVESIPEGKRPKKEKKNKLDNSQWDTSNEEQTVVTPSKKKKKKIENQIESGDQQENGESSENSTSTRKVSNAERKIKSKEKKGGKENVSVHQNKSNIVEKTPSDSQDNGELETPETTKVRENIISNAQKRIKAKHSKEKWIAKENLGMHHDKTIFVGNVPVNTTKSDLRKLFLKYGQIESIRFRCVPVADPKTSKKVAAIKKEFHTNRTSLNSYIRFFEPEDSKKAIVENGVLFNEHHIRVSHCKEEVEKKDESRALFIGNLSFDSEEEDLWKLFECCGKIESVRLVRDRRTNIGKGFGYVNFVNSDGVELALQMGSVSLKNRQLRVSVSNAEGAKRLKKKTLRNNRISSKSDNAPTNLDKYEKKPRRRNQINDASSTADAPKNLQKYEKKPRRRNQLKEAENAANAANATNDTEDFPRTVEKTVDDSVDKPKKSKKKRKLEENSNETANLEESEVVSPKKKAISEDNPETSKVVENFQGIKFTDKKKKKKFDKGSHQKKKMAKLFKPKV